MAIPNWRPNACSASTLALTRSIFGGRVTASVTAFHNRYTNLVQFGAGRPARRRSSSDAIFNVGRADTRGLEFAGDASLVPERAAPARDLHLSRRRKISTKTRKASCGKVALPPPAHKGSASLIFTAVPSLDLEARVTFTVGPRHPDYDFSTKRVMLAPYARFDLYANYKVNDFVSIFGRIENVGDARYEEVYNYGTPGRSIYGGVKLSW